MTFLLLCETDDSEWLAHFASFAHSHRPKRLTQTLFRFDVRGPDVVDGYEGLDHWFADQLALGQLPSDLKTNRISQHAVPKCGSEVDAERESHLSNCPHCHASIGSVILTVKDFKLELRVQEWSP